MKQYEGFVHLTYKNAEGDILFEDKMTQEEYLMFYNSLQFKNETLWRRFLIKLGILKRRVEFTMYPFP